MDLGGLQERIIRLRRLAESGWNWWIGELAELVPSGIRVQLARLGPERIVLSVALETLDVSLVRGGVSEMVGRIDYRGDPTLVGRELNSLLSPTKRRRRVDASLARDLVLLKPLDLPLTAEADLYAVMDFEVERQTPFTREQIYFDVIVRSRLPERQKLRADLAVVRRATVDYLAAVMEAAGLRLNRVGLAGAAATNSTEFDFLRLTENQPELDRNRRAVRALAALALVLTVTAIMLWQDRFKREAEALQERVARARVEARATETVREEIQVQVNRGQFLVAKKQAPPVVRVIDEVTRLLPDGTALFEFHLAGPEIRISGYTSSASVLPGLIDRSPLFANGRFRSPITQGPRNGLERVDLSFDVRGR